MEEIKVRTNSDKPKEKPKKRRMKKKTLYVAIGLAVVVLLLAGTSIYFYQKYHQLKNNPEQVSKQETDDIVAKVGKLITLPDETPSIATIIDKGKLKDQPFFNNAENGDKVLVYTKAEKAIIYRPTSNKIINVGPVTLNQNGAVPVAVVSAGGNVNDASKKLTDKFGSGVSVVTSGDAKNKTSISKTTVVDVSGQNAQVAQDIATQLGATVGSLPSGETAPQGAAVVVFVK